MESSGETFERRYYDQLRRQRVVAGVGGLAVGELVDLQKMEKRRREEITDVLAESIVGRVNSRYAFDIVDGRLIGLDGEPTGDMLARWTTVVAGMAEQNSFYDFAVERNQHELDELANQEMLPASNRNALLAFSVYNEDLLEGLAGTELTETENLLKPTGQKPQWRRSMIRLSYWDGDQLQVLTKSFDNLPKVRKLTPKTPDDASSLAILREAAYRVLGYNFDATTPNDMLGERINLTFNSLDEAEAITQAIVDSADNRLSEIYGGQWRGGRPLGEDRDTYAFVEQNRQVVDHLIDHADRIASEVDDYVTFEGLMKQEMYGSIALLESAYERGAKIANTDIGSAVSTAASVAASEGKTYDACGYILGDAKDQSKAASGFESAFGLMSYLGRSVHCPGANCGKDVYVPVEALSEGLLFCPECELCVDPCGDESKVRRFMENRQREKAKAEAKELAIKKQVEQNRRRSKRDRQQHRKSDRRRERIQLSRRSN